MLSNIKYINNKYILNLPLIKRKFDSIFINYKKVNSSFGKFFEGIFFENTVFGVSNFGEKKLFYFLDLENFLEKEFLINKFEIFDINIFNKKYSILVLFLENGEIEILSKLKNSQFKIFIENGILKVKNLELNSIILKTPPLAPPPLGEGKMGKKVFDKKYTSILDIYFFNNFFIKQEKILDFQENIEKFIFKNNKFENKFYPRNKLEIFEEGFIKKEKSFFEKLFSKKENRYEKLELLKIFLEFKNNYDFVLDFINYKDLNKYFENFNKKNIFISKDIETIKKINFKNINIDKIDENLENINKQIQDFSLNYYELEKNYDKINKLNLENKNSKILEQTKRLEIFRESLEKIKKEYLKYFKEFLDKLI